MARGQRIFGGLAVEDYVARLRERLLPLAKHWLLSSDQLSIDFVALCYQGAKAGARPARS